MSEFKSLSVGIVGAGVAGLSSAIALRRAGHAVTILESSTDLSKDATASVAAAANASQFLKEWGVDWTSAGPTSLKRLTMKKWADGELINEFDMSGYTAQWGSPYLMFDRKDMVKMLVDAATAVEGDGTPVKILFNHEVKAVDETGAVSISGVEKPLQFDLVIGADGVNSTLKSFVVPNAPESVPNQATCLKFNVSAAKAVEAGLKDFTSSEGVNFWLGSSNRKIVLSPTHDLSTMSFYVFFPCTETWTNDSPEGFHLPIESVESLLATEPLQDLDPACYSLFKLATDITQWKLRAQEELTTWNRGVVGLIGDAAHYMFPDQSQATSTVLEDAAALGLVFSATYPDFTRSKEGIIQGLRVYESVRKPRASRVQSASARAREDVKERIGFSDQAAPPGGYKGVGSGALTIQELNQYNMRGHIADVVAAAPA